MFVGIDISKLTFDVAILQDGEYQHRHFDNNSGGFVRCLKWVKSFKTSALFCLEATGIYCLALAKCLCQQQQKPLLLTRFKPMHSLKWKCLAIKPTRLMQKVLLVMPSIDQLNKMRTQKNNWIDISLDKAAIQPVKAMCKLFIDKQLLSVQATIADIVKRNPQLNEQVELITSIAGLGNKTAWAILAYVGDVSLFNNAKQIMSYAGLNPSIQQSGSSLNRSRLSKMGCAWLRESLYMPALVAVRYNPLMMDLYDRLQAKGKPKKEALVAVMRKLLVLAYAVLKSGKPFDINYQQQVN